MQAIQFFFEFASPYSYIASLQIERLAMTAGCSVYWRPIELQAVWSAHGVLEAYSTIRKLKREYIARDSRRVAAAQGIRLAAPPRALDGHRIPKLVYWGIHEENPTLAVHLLQRVWHRYFVEGAPIDTIEDVAAASVGIGLKPEDIRQASLSAAASLSLNRSSEDAIRCGCFGVPWFLAADQSFFGQDRLPDLARCLAGDDA